MATLDRSSGPVESMRPSEQPSLQYSDIDEFQIDGNRDKISTQSSEIKEPDFLNLNTQGLYGPELPSNDRPTKLLFSVNEDGQVIKDSEEPPEPFRLPKRISVRDDGQVLTGKLGRDSGKPDRDGDKPDRDGDKPDLTKLNKLSIRRVIWKVDPVTGDLVGREKPKPELPTYTAERDPITGEIILNGGRDPKDILE